MLPGFSRIHVNEGVNPNVFGSALPALAMLAGLLMTVFWMIVGWRAMRAHERLADATDEIARRGR